MEAIRIDGVPADLMQAFEHDPNIIMTPMLNGTEAIQRYFTVDFARDKKTYSNMEIFDAIRVAGQDFDPVEAAKMGVRKVQLEDFDIDLTLTRETIKGWVRSYLSSVTNMNREKPLIESQSFPMFALQEIIKRQFGFLYLGGAWQGNRLANGRKSGDSVTGLLERLTEGRASGGDIPSSNVHTAAAITESNAYEEVNAVAELVYNSDPAYLNQGLELRMSADTYLKYKRNRRTLFDKHVSPSENPTTLDDFQSIRIVQDPGLAGKQTIVLADPSIFKATINENVGDYSMSIVKNVKSWDFNLHFSLCFDYAWGKKIYLNTHV